MEDKGSEMEAENRIAVAPAKAQPLAHKLSVGEGKDAMSRQDV